MTDQERIARLRKQHSAGRASHLSKADRLDIADRIEELVKELDISRMASVVMDNTVEELESKLALMIFERDEVMMFERDEAWKRAAYSEKMWGEAEVKLSKAVEALGLIVVDNTWGLEHETYMKCRATLAEIKSHSDEFATQKGERHD